MDVPNLEQLTAAARRLLSGRGGVALLAVVALVAAYVASVPDANGDSGRGAAIDLSVLVVVPLMIARRWPSFAAAASTVMTVVVLRAHEAPLAVASFAITLFLLVQLVIRRGLFLAAPLLLPFVVLALSRLGGPYSTLGTTAPLLFLLAALVVGESMRRRRLAVEALDVTQDAMAESIRMQTVMEERARIARELHDIVAHHLSVIAVESETARLTSPELSSVASDRLEAIASTAREALTETRRLLGVLREDNEAKPERTPQPGLDQLDDLIDKAQMTGARIRLVREGKIVRLPPGIDLAAYRIVQEALTNARRHASGADVDVEVSYREHAVDLRIRDYGPGLLDGGAVEGHGLMGMRERAALAGGTFSSGSAEGGGFEVDITLPLPEAAP